MTESCRSGIPAEILETFWGLAETDDAIRVRSAGNLLEILQQSVTTRVANGSLNDSAAMSDTDGQKLPEALQYTLKRLIKGLSSNRKAAPIGFSMALCELLRQFTSISLTHALCCIKETLRVTKMDKKSQQNHTMIGQVMAYLALIRSGRIKQSSKKELEELLRGLANVRSEQPLLANITTQVYIQLWQVMPLELLKPLMMESLNDELSGGWKACTPDTVHLLLLLVKQGFVDKDFLEQHWDSKKLISAENFDSIASVMKKSTCTHPIIHAVNEEIINAAAATGPKTFRKFWRSVVIGSVYSLEKHNRTYMLYQVIPSVLSKLCTSKTVPLVLCAELLGPLIKQLSHREAILHSAAVEMLGELTEICKRSTDGDYQLAVLRTLISEPGSYLFDSITCTKTISTLAQHLTSTACKTFISELTGVISHGSSLWGNEGEGVIHWAAQTLAHLLTATSMQDESQLHSDLLKLFLLRSCFIVKQPISDVTHCDSVSSPLQSAATRNILRDSLLKGLDALSSLYSRRGVAVKSSSSYIGILRELVHYVDTLLSRSDSVVAVRVLGVEEVDVWRKTMLLIKSSQKIIAKLSDEVAVEREQAFQLMLLLFGIHLVIAQAEDVSETMDVLKEIWACYEKSGSLKSKTTVNEPEWYQVIVEILISLMSKSSHLLRSVSTTVFTKVLPFCDVKVISMITDVFKSSDEESDDAMLDFDDGEDEHSSEEAEAEAENGSDKSDSSEESDDESDVEQEEVDEDLRATVRAALGSAAAASEGEDDDMSDSEMFKLDGALSDAFRSMMRGKKNAPSEVEKRRQILHFRLRCLDFLEVIVKHSTHRQMLLGLLMPLLTLTEAGFRSKEMKPVGKRAGNILQHLIGLKKLPHDGADNEGHPVEILREILSLSTNAYGMLMSKEIASSIIFLIRLFPTTKDSESSRSKPSILDEMTDVIGQAVKDFLTKRESRYSHTLFYSIIERQPIMFWSLNATFLSVISSADIRVFCRTQACSMLALLIQRNMITEVGKTSWLKFVKNLHKSIADVQNYSLTNYKIGFLQEFFSLLLKCKAVDKSLRFELTAIEEMKPKFSKELARIYRRLAHGEASPSKRKISEKRIKANTESAPETINKKQRKAAL